MLRTCFWSVNPLKKITWWLRSAFWQTLSKISRYVWPHVTIVLVFMLFISQFCLQFDTTILFFKVFIKKCVGKIPRFFSSIMVHFLIVILYVLDIAFIYNVWNINVVINIIITISFSCYNRRFTSITRISLMTFWIVKCICFIIFYIPSTVYQKILRF